MSTTAHATHADARLAPAHDGREARRASLVLLLLTGVFAVSAWWRPSELPALTLCPFRALTGWPCPGCGMTRAFCALGHGDWRAALGFNALSPFVLLAFVWMWARAAATLFGLAAARTFLERLRPGRAVSLALLALTFAWWAARLAAGL